MAATWFPRVLAVNLLLALIIQGVRPIVSYKALALDAGPSAVGLIAASFAALSFIIAVPAGRWVDSVGEAGGILAGTIAIILAAVGLAITQNLVLLGVAMLVLGAGHIVAAVGVQTLIANGGDPERMDARFATQTVFASIGQFVGPGAAGLMVGHAAGDASGVTVAATSGVFWTAAEAAAAASVLALSLWLWPPKIHARQVRPEVPAAERKGLFGTISSVAGLPSMPQALLVGSAALSSIDVIIAYLPVYGVAYGIPVKTIGWLLAVRGGASIAARALMLPLRKTFGRRNVLAGSVLIPGIALLAVPTFGSSVVPLYLTMALVGVGLGLCQPLTISWIAATAPSDLRGAAFGLRLSFNRLGQFALPTTVGLVAGGSGVAFIFAALGLLLLAAAAVTTRSRIG